MNYAEYKELSKQDKNELIKTYRDKHFWEIPEDVVAIIICNNKKIANEINDRKLRDEHPEEFIKASNAFKKWIKEERQYIAHLKTLKKQKAYGKEKEAKERKRKEREEYDKVHTKKMSKEEKVLLAKALLTKENTFLKNQLNPINNIITKNVKNITVDTYKEALDIIIRIDIRELLGLNVKLKENFSCRIISGNTASIAVDENGIYRYFSWNNDHSKGYALSYIDIAEIIHNLTYGRALNLILKQLKINVKEGG